MGLRVTEAPDTEYVVEGAYHRGKKDLRFSMSDVVRRGDISTANTIEWETSNTDDICASFRTWAEKHGRTDLAAFIPEKRGSGRKSGRRSLPLRPRSHSQRRSPTASRRACGFRWAMLGRSLWLTSPST